MIFGTSIILHLLVGNFLLEGGLSNLNYLLLALLCAMPFLLYVIISGNNIERVTNVILTSGLFFLILFVYANFILVFSMTVQSQVIAVRSLITFPALALILVIVLHFSQSENLAGKVLIER